MPEQFVNSPQFVPDDESVLDAASALAATEASIEDDPNAVDLIVAAQQPEPVGRSYKFDFSSRSFYRGVGGKSPLNTVGDGTLRGWIEKCLLTARGAHPVHPEGYGLAPSAQTVFGMPVGRVPADLEDRIREALQFHPRVSDIENFAFDFDPDDNFLALDFDVLLDDDTLLPINGLTLQGVI